jgi:hypothetical protein
LPPVFGFLIELQGGRYRLPYPAEYGTTAPFHAKPAGQQSTMDHSCAKFSKNLLQNACTYSYKAWQSMTGPNQSSVKLRSPQPPHPRTIQAATLSQLLGEQESCAKRKICSPHAETRRRKGAGPGDPASKGRWVHRYCRPRSGERKLGAGSKVQIV